MERAVERGLARRQAEEIPYLGVDEKAFRKGHKYLTLVNDLTRSRVLYVAEDREQSSLDGFWPTITAEQQASIEAVALDMWDPYVASVRGHLPKAEEKMVFDKFHIAKHLGEAVDRVRRREHKVLKAEGDERLKGTKYDWLRNPASMEGEQKRELRKSELKTARAWALKETAGAQSVAADEGGSRDAEAPLREHHHLSTASHHQCCERIAQREDPVDQIHSSGIPEQTEFH